MDVFAHDLVEVLSNAADRENPPEINIARVKNVQSGKIVSRRE